MLAFRTEISSNSEDELISVLKASMGSDHMPPTNKKEDFFQR